MIDTADILLKAAEDAQSGMWCKDAWFQHHETGELFYDTAVFTGAVSIDEALASKRCAQGSIAVATHLLGGAKTEYSAAVRAVDWHLYARGDIGLIGFNDMTLPDDAFEAGAQLSELFRTVAESL